MHEIGTHVIEIQIAENIHNLFQNQKTIRFYALGSASRLAQQSKTLLMMPSHYKIHLHWPRTRLSEELTQIFTKGLHFKVPFRKILTV